MTRFCWRERTERVNWRFLRNLQLAEIVRRGDATLLEPYALHLTFAKLPVVAAALAPSRHDVLAADDEAGQTLSSRVESRNAWFVVRVLQLAMEYLLFLRARDGAVVDSLREELLLCERECELLVERAAKWKARSRGGEKQVEKLHQVLQSIAKLLQIEGATANAVSTIESLLRDLVPLANRRGDGSGGGLVDPSPARVDEARICALCGKMFSSQEFLEKHTIRRHAGADIRTMKPTRQAWVVPAGRDDDNQAEEKQSTARNMKAMLRTVEQTLQEHQTTLRTVAQQEAEKLHSLYEQLHVETQLAEEMRAKRVAGEQQVEQSRRELEQIQHDKEAVLDETRILNEQLQFLVMKKKIEAQNGNISSISALPDSTLQLELQRLEETIGVLQDALATARQELHNAHERHSVVLKEKYELESQLHEAKNHALRLGARLRSANDVVPPARIDSGVQATVLSATAMVQTDDSPPAERMLVDPSPVSPVRVAADEVAVQTEHEEQTERIDSMVQTDPFETLSIEHEPPLKSPTTSIGVGVEADLLVGSDEDLDSVFRSKCASIMELVAQRAERSANSKASGASPPDQDDKLFSSLARRRYLGSRFLHDEHDVKERITFHVAKLEQTSLRYGVSPQSSVLANEHVEVVQRALHAHLEVLPAVVLQRMIEIDATVTSLIQTEWIPQEKSRQQALERLTANLEVQSQVNQGLVRQAMAAFALGDQDKDATAVSTKTSECLYESTLGSVVKEVTQADEPTKDTDAPALLAASGQAVGGVATSDCVSCSHQAETLVSQAVDADDGDAEVDDRKFPTLSVIIEDPTESDTKPELFASRQEPSGAPSPESVQSVRRQAIAVRSVKVLSVSPKSSPPKLPPPAVAEMSDTAVPSRVSGDETSQVGYTGTARTNNEEPTLAAREEEAPETEAASTNTNEIQPTLSSLHRGPSSFSARHPASQLGIEIPSRYHPTTINVHGLHEEQDADSESDYSHARSSRELRWSSSAGRSVSAVASSELSFDASIPSLESDGVSRSFPASSTEMLPQVSKQIPQEDDQAENDLDSDPNGVLEIQGIASIRAENSDSEEVAQPVAALQRTEVSERQGSPQHSSPPPSTSQVMAFDGDSDSDIEEVMLA